MRNWTLVVECRLATADLRLVRRDGMAQELGTTDSTLSRHLVRERTSWGYLLDTERKRRCEAVLYANRRACAQRLMSRCGLGRQSMSKAMHRWFGMTMTEVRCNALERKSA